jgi:hypothetical protein
MFKSKLAVQLQLRVPNAVDFNVDMEQFFQISVSYKFIAANHRKKAKSAQEILNSNPYSLRRTCKSSYY